MLGYGRALGTVLIDRLFLASPGSDDALCAFVFVFSHAGLL